MEVQSNTNYPPINPDKNPTADTRSKTYPSNKSPASKIARRTGKFLALISIAPLLLFTSDTKKIGKSTLDLRQNLFQIMPENDLQSTIAKRQTKDQILLSQINDKQLLEALRKSTENPYEELRVDDFRDLLESPKLNSKQLDEYLTTQCNYDTSWARSIRVERFKINQKIQEGSYQNLRDGIKKTYFRLKQKTTDKQNHNLLTFFWKLYIKSNKQVDIQDLILGETLKIILKKAKINLGADFMTMLEYFPIAKAHIGNNAQKQEYYRKLVNNFLDKSSFVYCKTYNKTTASPEHTNNKIVDRYTKYATAMSVLELLQNRPDLLKAFLGVPGSNGQKLKIYISDKITPSSKNENSLGLFAARPKKSDIAIILKSNILKRPINTNNQKTYPGIRTITHEIAGHGLDYLDYSMLGSKVTADNINSDGIPISFNHAERESFKRMRNEFKKTVKLKPKHLQNTFEYSTKNNKEFWAEMCAFTATQPDLIKNIHPELFEFICKYFKLNLSVN